MSRALLSPEFVITESRQGAAAIIELHGELDLAVAPLVFAGFDKLLASDPTAVIVDLRALSFIDVRGMHALIALRTSCEEHGRRFVLVRGQPAIHRLLALCDLERTFELVNSVAEAREMTGAIDESLIAIATKPRVRSALNFAEHRHLTIVPIDGARMSPSLDSGHARPPLESDALHAPEAPTLQVDVKPDRDRVLVCPAGDVDLATADTLESRIVDLLQNGFARVVVDLRAVTFIDSTGIHALLNAHHRARESARSISIILGSTTRRTLELVGVTDYLELEPGCRNGTP